MPRQTARGRERTEVVRARSSDVFASRAEGLPEGGLAVREGERAGTLYKRLEQTLYRNGHHLLQSDGQMLAGCISFPCL